MDASRKAKPEADLFASPGRLLWGFVGALFVAAAGKVLPGASNKVWLTILVAILIGTSFGQAIPAGAYEGLVVGLFYNFFFLSSNEELTFHSAGEWELELAFIATGVAAAVLGRMVSRARTAGRAELPSAAPASVHPFLWRPHRSDVGPTSDEGDPWTQ